MTGGEVYVAGTRTFAAEVVDFARDAGLSVEALLEPREPGRVGSAIHELPVGALEEGPGGDSRSVIVGTGDIDRREVVTRLVAAGWEIIRLVHPQAHVAGSASLGEGVLVGPGVVIGARSIIGDHVVLGRGSLVGHHVRIGEFATLAPGANVAGNVTVEKDAFLGMGAVVRDHVTVGAEARVGMGAVVVSDVPAGADVRGIPARPRLD